MTNPVDLWRGYGRHAEVMLSAGPAPSVRRSDGSFIVLSGGPHVDLNQAAIFGAGDGRDALAIVETTRAADVPCLLAVSSAVQDDVSDTLRDGGFERAPEREALFYAAVPPDVGPSAFQVRQVTTSDDRAGIERVLAESHATYGGALVASMWGPALLDRPDVGGWLAWDDDEPVSCCFVTRVDRSLGVFDMMTPARHRRRGAARAVLTQALSEASGWGDQANAIAFWATPLGRPLYESLGFTVADTMDVWTLGASLEDLAAVGVG